MRASDKRAVRQPGGGRIGAGSTARGEQSARPRSGCYQGAVRQARSAEGQAAGRAGGALQHTRTVGARKGYAAAGTNANAHRRPGRRGRAAGAADRQQGRPGAAPTGTGPAAAGDGKAADGGGRAAQQDGRRAGQGTAQ